MAETVQRSDGSAPGAWAEVGPGPVRGAAPCLLCVYLMLPAVRGLLHIREAQHGHVCITLYRVGKAPAQRLLALLQPQVWPGVNPSKVCLESLLL